jgi:hypothetical protein
MSQVALIAEVPNDLKHCTKDMPVTWSGNSATAERLQLAHMPSPNNHEKTYEGSVPVELLRALLLRANPK